MKKTTSTESFSTTTQLKQLAMGAPFAVQRTVLIADETLATQPATEYMGVWNETSNKLACIASKKYNIVQHREVLEALSESLMDLNLSVRGTIEYYDDGDEMRAIVLFNEHVLKDDSEDGVLLGFRVVNSYNCSKGFRGDIYAYRLVCTNGLSMPVFDDGVYKRIHIGEFSASAGITEFIEKVIRLKPQFQRLIENSMQVELEKEAWVPIIERLVKHKKHQKRILELFNAVPKAKMSKWDIYNVFTDYMSHQPIAGWAQVYYTEVATDVLQKPLETLVLAK